MNKIHRNWFSINEHRICYFLFLVQNCTVFEQTSRQDWACSSNSLFHKSVTSVSPDLSTFRGCNLGNFSQPPNILRAERRRRRHFVVWTGCRRPFMPYSASFGDLVKRAAGVAGFAYHRSRQMRGQLLVQFVRCRIFITFPKTLNRSLAVDDFMKRG